MLFLYFSKWMQYYIISTDHSPDAFEAMFNFSIQSTPNGNINFESHMKDRQLIYNDASSRGYSANKLSNSLGYFWIDNVLETLVNYLDNNNILDDTIIIVMNDHGMGAKFTLYETGVRVFNFIRYPSLSNTIDNTIINDTLFSQIDIAPTLFDLIGININDTYPYSIDGESVLNKINSNNNTPQYRFVEYNRNRGIIYYDKANNISMKYIWNIESSNYESSILTKYSFANNIGEQLFDLNTDINEQTNIVNNPEYQPILELLRDKMKQYITESCASNVYQYCSGIFPPNITYTSPSLYPTNNPVAMSPQCNPDGSDWMYSETYRVLNGLEIRYIEGSGCPDHKYYRINNPNNPTLQYHSLSIPCQPCFADRILNVECRGNTLSIAFNGVSMYGQTSGPGCNNAVLNEGDSFDNCSGHATRFGDYHYHIPPACLLHQLNDTNSKHSPMISYAQDGIPIYGPRGISGEYMLPCTHINSNPSDCVDECNGHWHETNDNSGYLYHYHFLGNIGDLKSVPVNPLPTIDYWPYYPKCFKGVVLGTSQQCIEYNLTKPNFRCNIAPSNPNPPNNTSPINTTINNPTHSPSIIPSLSTNNPTSNPVMNTDNNTSNDTNSYKLSLYCNIIIYIIYFVVSIF